MLNNKVSLAPIFIVILTIIFLPCSSISKTAGELTNNTLKRFLAGPEKDWSAEQLKDYYEWRNSVYRQMETNNGDPQILKRQKAIINGNKITTEIWNSGSISSPENRTTDIVWEGLGYGYEFGPFICAEVEVPEGSHLDAYQTTNSEGETIWAARVISDGLVSLGGEVSPDGKEFWGWEPLAYNDFGVPYADPVSDNIPTSNDLDRDKDGKPDSWPSGWYNPNLKEFVWPGALRQGASNADLESFFVVDDRNNKEFEYYPFPDDSGKKGLGLEIECRYYQWANPMAEDIIFLIFKVTNKSPKDLHKVIFGMWGDPHIGGPSNWQDDLSFFDRNINMVYAWDEDGQSDITGRKPGYFGYKFLESPGNPYDDVDNDLDSLVDESRFNGIDDDDDWSKDPITGEWLYDSEGHYIDDVGVDGIPHTGDEGEYDNEPTAGDPFDIRKPGEPNFEWTDLDEADMIGLTGFQAPPFKSQNRISNDNYIFENYLTPGEFDSGNVDQAGDYIFLYSSGPMILPAGEARRFSIALIVGQDYEDLTLNAVTAQDIYERNYQFAKPPEKPFVTAVPGDEKITLYWDAAAESSIDPISQKNDFEGYVIYRSIHPGFEDRQDITDAYGSSFLFEPLKMITGAPARFDLDNEYVGLSKIPYPGRGTSYNLGSNTGIRHTFIDSNNVINGQSYYYSVVSYDHGDDSLMIPPTECSKTITLNPETDEVILDVNTIKIVPRAPAAGYQQGYIDNDWISHDSGVATGDISIEIIDYRMLADSGKYEIRFNEINDNLTYFSVADVNPVEEEILVRTDTFIGLSHKNIDDTTFVLTSLDGNQIYSDSLDYELNPQGGLLMALEGGLLTDGSKYRASYRYFPIVDGKLLNNEEGNPVFNGMRLYLRDDPLSVDNSITQWGEMSNSTYKILVYPYGNDDDLMYGADYEIRFIIDSVRVYFNPTDDYYVYANFEIWDVTKGRFPSRVPVTIKDNNEDSLWGLGDEAAIYWYDSPEYLVGGDMEDQSVWEASGSWTVNEGGTGVATVMGNGTDQDLSQMVTLGKNEIHTLFYKITDNTLQGGTPGYRMMILNSVGNVIFRKPVYLNDEIGEHSIEFKAWNAAEKAFTIRLLADVTSGEITIDNISLINAKKAWEFQMYAPDVGDTIPPSEGDIFYIATSRPFTSEDRYGFETTASKVNADSAKKDLSKISVVPNPYVITNVLEPLDHQNRRDRGSRRLYFNHLPQKCTIRIYTITGELVDTIYHDSIMDDGKEFWNLTTKDNFPIAFGVYLYHVDAGDLGEKIGRFAVIK